MIAKISLSPSPGSIAVENSLHMSALEFHHQSTPEVSVHHVTLSTGAPQTDLHQLGKEEA